MHQKLDKQDTELTDSMKMFKWGVEGGKPAGGKPGMQPEWFYKGNGGNVVGLRPRRSPRPTSPRIMARSRSSSACYLIDDNGRPHRLGFAIGNEFSDHVTERRNYLLLAHSKLRQCGVGPDAQHRRHCPRTWKARAASAATAQVLWQKPFLTGEGEHVPHLRQPRVPPLQVQAASRARRRAPAFLRHRDA